VFILSKTAWIAPCFSTSTSSTTPVSHLLFFKLHFEWSCYCTRNYEIYCSDNCYYGSVLGPVQIVSCDKNTLNFRWNRAIRFCIFRNVFKNNRDLMFIFIFLRQWFYSMRALTDIVGFGHKNKFYYDIAFHI
jgi:hypothetical protein